MLLFQPQQPSVDWYLEVSSTLNMTSAVSALLTSGEGNVIPSRWCQFNHWHLMYHDTRVDPVYIMGNFLRFCFGKENGEQLGGKKSICRSMKMWAKIVFLNWHKIYTYYQFNNSINLLLKTWNILLYVIGYFVFNFLIFIILFFSFIVINLMYRKLYFDEFGHIHTPMITSQQSRE